MATKQPKKKSLTKKGKPKEMGFALYKDEFYDIISGKRNKIKREIASYGANLFWKDWIEKNKRVPDYFLSKYEPGTVMWMMESFRPELKPNGDIHRRWEDESIFVPATSEKYRKIRWHSNYNMRKKDSRLYLRIVKFSMDKAMNNWIWEIEIDMERSKPKYWPKVESDSKKINKVKTQKK